MRTHDKKGHKNAMAAVSTLLFVYAPKIAKGTIHRSANPMFLQKPYWLRKTCTREYEFGLFSLTKW